MRTSGMAAVVRCRLMFTEGIAAILILAGSSFDAAGASTTTDGLMGASVLNEYSMQVWRQDQGLPGNWVKSVLQTRNGYLWIATSSGAARFDGLAFQVFNRANTPEMINVDCLALAEDAGGAVWIGTMDGLLRYHGNAFTRYVFTNGLPGVGAELLLARPGGGVWIAGHNGRLGLFDPESSPRSVAVEVYPEAFVTSLAFVPPRRLWVGTSKGLCAVDAISGAVIDPNPVRPSEDVSSVAAIRAQGSDSLWAIFTRPFGHNYLYRLEEGKWVQCSPLELSNGSRPAFLLEDSEGAVWMPTQDHHLLRWRNGQPSLAPIPWDNRQTDFACSAHLDADGGIWIGTESSGLYRLQRSAARHYTRKDGLPSDNIYAVYQRTDGTMWVGTDAGACQLSADGFTTYSRRDGLARDDAVTFAEDGSKRLWIGTGNGLNIFAKNLLASHRFPAPGDRTDPDGVFQNKARAILSARDGSLWIGLMSGLHHLRDGQDNFYCETNGLPHHDVRALLEDAAGAIWIGTDGGGVAVLRDGQFTLLNKTNGLSDDHVSEIYQDSRGVVWIGTERGLNRYQNGRNIQFTARHGLWDEEIISLVEDDEGCFWIGSRRQLFRVKLNELDAVASGFSQIVHSYPFETVDGFPAGEINGTKSYPSALKSSDGRLWFCTTKGLLVIEPKLAARHGGPPSVVIEQLRANGQIFFGSEPPDSSIAGLDQREVNPQLRLDPGRVRAVDPTEVFQLPAGSGTVLEFHYTACAFVSAAKARFKYRLEGYEDTWHDAGTRRVAYYTNLRPRHYTFRVLGCNNHNVWSEAGAAFPFYLEPYYYQTWWFFALCAGGGMLLIYGVIALRMNHLRRISQLERQVALEEQRNRIARDIHDELGLSLSQIARLADSNGRSKGPAASPEPGAPRIAELAEAAVNSIEEIVWANNSRYDTLEDLVAFLREQAARSVADTSIQAHFDFPNEVPSRAVSGLFRRHIVAVLKEALHNVLKHASAREVQVRLALAGEALELEVTDDGRGLTPDANSRLGNGLINMRTRLAEIGGTVDVQSRLPSGVRVFARTPLPPVTTESNREVQV